jgi:WD40 repeat protein
VVSGGLDSKIVLWDYSRGKPLYSFDLSSEQRGQQQLVNPPFVHSIDVSEDGGLLAAGVGDFSVCIYHLPSRKLVHRLEAHMSSVSQVMFPAFAPMNHVLSAGNDNLILLWCLPSLASYSRKKKNKSQSECNIDSSAESQPVLKLEHSSKINWMTTSNTPVVFVADQTSDISMYSLI